MNIIDNIVLPRKCYRCRSGFLSVLVVLVIATVSSELVAISLDRLELTSDDGEYNIRLEMTLDAPAKYVREVLTDYTHIYRLNPSIIDSRIMESPSIGTTRVYTRISDCVLFFCTEISRVEDVRHSGEGRLVAVIVPELSDFESGSTSWEIVEKKGQSVVVYNAIITPSFFIPSIVGDYFVKSKLKQTLMMSIRRIECNAKIRYVIARNADMPINAVQGIATRCQT